MAIAAYPSLETLRVEHISSSFAEGTRAGGKLFLELPRCSFCHFPCATLVRFRGFDFGHIKTNTGGYQIVDCSFLFAITV